MSGLSPKPMLPERLQRGPGTVQLLALASAPRDAGAWPGAVSTTSTGHLPGCTCKARAPSRSPLPGSAGQELALPAPLQRSLLFQKPRSASPVTASQPTCAGAVGVI